MKTATEYDVHEDYEVWGEVSIKCPECEQQTWARYLEWERGICDCTECPQRFKLLPLDEVLKQAKEKRETEQQVQEAVQAACLEGVLEAVVLDAAREKTHDPVSHPKHYTGHPSGVECIQITEHMTFCRGNAMKYLWRAGGKGNEIEDLKKARWYIDREIQRLEGGA